MGAGHHLTRDYAVFLARWERRLSWKEVSTIFQVSWEKVCRSVAWGVEYGLEHRHLDGITAIGVDEIQFQKGYRYLTVVYQINAGCRRLLWYDLKSVRGYLLKQSFQLLWEYVSPYWAGRFLDGWVKRAMRSRLEPIKKVARSIRSHRELILNGFKAKKEFNSGIVEGLNYKIKLTLRKAYGYRELKVAEIPICHALGNLPEPILTHRFC